MTSLPTVCLHEAANIINLTVARQKAQSMHGISLPVQPFPFHLVVCPIRQQNLGLLLRPLRVSVNYQDDDLVINSLEKINFIACIVHSLEVTAKPRLDYWCHPGGMLAFSQGLDRERLHCAYVRI